MTKAVAFQRLIARCDLLLSLDDNAMKSRIISFLSLCILVSAIAACGGSTGRSAAGDSFGSGANNPLALVTAKPGELVDFTKQLLRTRAGLRKTGNLAPSQDELTQAVGGPVAVPANTSLTSKDSSTRSGTTNQEAGVDEDDLLKIDGNKIYALQRAAWGNEGFVSDRLHVYQRAADGSLSKPDILDLAGDTNNDVAMRGMLNVEGSGKIALIGETNRFIPFIDCAPNSLCARPAVVLSEAQTILQWVDASANTLRLSERLTMDGQLVGARQIEDHIYLTIRHRPKIAADQLPIDTKPEALEAAINALKISELLPNIRSADGQVRPLVAESDCYLQTANSASDIQVTVMIAWRISDPPDRWTSRCFFGGTQAIYMSPKNLYFATSRNQSSWVDGTFRFSDQMRTDIHQFAISGGSMKYMGSGEIPGHLGWDPGRAAYRMSEHEGDLRVVSFTGTQGWLTLADAASKSKAASPATLSILRPQSTTGKLQLISTLPNSKYPNPLGLPGEQLYGVRFESKRAYLVTFRQTDPLYILDLSDPLDPRMIGELKMPGYSDYLFPLPGNLLLGIGKDATDSGQVLGVRVALIDLKMPSSPRELQVLNFGERGSSSGLDYSSHGINLLQVGNITRVALPLSLAQQSGSNYIQGLQTISIDVDIGNMKAHKWMASAASTGWTDVSRDRSVQIGNFVYYWSQNQLRAFQW